MAIDNEFQRQGLGANDGHATSFSVEESVMLRDLPRPSAYILCDFNQTIPALDQVFCAPLYISYRISYRNTFTMTSLIQLDWHNPIASSKLLSQMQIVLTNMDHTRIATIELADPSRRSAAKIESLDGSMMWVRESCANDKKVSTHHGLVAKFMAVGLQIITMINFHEPRKTRKLQYLLQSKQISVRLLSPFFTTGP